MTKLQELEKEYENIRFWSNNNLESEISALYAQIKEQEAKLANLKDNLKFKIQNDEELNKKFLIKRELNEFTSNNIHNLPTEFLKLNATAINKVYKSIVGGKKFLKQWKLKVSERHTYSFNPKLGKEVK